MKNAITYSRVSSEKQSGHWESLESQRSMTADQCIVSGWLLLREFLDQISWMLIERPVFEDIYNYIKECSRNWIKVDYLVIHKIDRLSRWWPRVYNEFKKRLELLWVEIRDCYWTIQDSLIVWSLKKYNWGVYEWAKVNPSEITENIISISAEQERKQILQRTLPREIELAYEWYWVRPPRQWYQNKAIQPWKTIQVPHLEEAKFLRKMFEMKAEYIPDIEIVEEINTMWFLTREFNKWDKRKMNMVGKWWWLKLDVGMLQSYIKNPIYAWVARVHWKCVPKAKLVIQKYPGLVSVELWNSANQWKRKLIIEWNEAMILEWDILLSFPTIKRRLRNNPEYPFSKLVYADWTQNYFNWNSPTGRNWVKYKYYSAQAETRRMNINKEDFESSIIDFINTLEIDNDWWGNLFENCLVWLWQARSLEISVSQQVKIDRLSKLDNDKVVLLNEVSALINFTEILIEKNKQLLLLKNEILEIENSINNSEIELNIVNVKRYWKFFIENMWKIALESKDNQMLLLLFQFIFKEIPTYWSILNRNSPLNLMLALGSKKRTIDDSLICSNIERNVLWQPHSILSRNIEEEMTALLEWYQSEELMKNLESWNELFSKKHNRMLIERESLRLWITL